MSRFSGPQYKGATRALRDLKRAEAVTRQESAAADVAKGLRDHDGMDAAYVKRIVMQQRRLARQAVSR